MSMMSVVFEGGVVAVLILVAGLCWRLDRRLTALKSGQDGVRRTVIELAEATVRAQESVRELRAASEQAGRDLEEKVVRARSLADELLFLVERAPQSQERARVRDPEPPPARTRSRAALELTDAESVRLRDRLRGVR